jgi:hypothetical protein
MKKVARHSEACNIRDLTLGPFLQPPPIQYNVCKVFQLIGNFPPHMCTTFHFNCASFPLLGNKSPASEGEDWQHNPPPTRYNFFWRDPKRLHFNIVPFSTDLFSFILSFAPGPLNFRPLLYLQMEPSNFSQVPSTLSSNSSIIGITYL